MRSEIRKPLRSCHFLIVKVSVSMPCGSPAGQRDPGWAMAINCCSMRPRNRGILYSFCSMGSAFFTAASAAFAARSRSSRFPLTTVFRLNRAPGHRRCAAEHHPGIGRLIPGEHDRQGHAGQSEVPGTTCPDLAVGTSQALRRRRQDDFRYDLCGFEHGLPRVILGRAAYGSFPRPRFAGRSGRQS